MPLLHKNLILRTKELYPLLEKIKLLPEEKAGGLYVIAGRAGMGKTTFFGQIAEELSKNSLFPLLLKQTLNADSTLTQLVAAILQQILFLRPNSKLLQSLSSHQSAIAHDLLGDLAITNPSPRTSENPSFADICFVLQRVLTSSSRDEDYGIIFIIDDFHLADAQTIECLKELARYILAEGLPIFLLLGYRDTPQTGPGLRDLDELVLSLNDSKLSLGARSFSAGILSLAPLNHKQVADLLDGRFNPGFSKINHHFAGWITEQSGGNPYYIRLLAENGANRGIITQEDKVGWTVSPSYSDMDCPKTLEEMLWNRLEPLLEEGVRSRALTAAATLGTCFLFSHWQTLSEIPRRELLDILMELERLDLMRDEMDGDIHRVCFSHPLIAETVLNKLHGQQYALCQGRAARMLLEQKDYTRALNAAIKAEWDPDTILTILDRALGEAVSKNDWPSIQQWHRRLNGQSFGNHCFFWLAAIEAAYALGLHRESIELGESNGRLLADLSPEQRIRYHWLMHNCFLGSNPDKCQALISEGKSWAATLSPEIRNIAEKEFGMLQLSFLSTVSEIEKGLSLCRELKEKYSDDKFFIFRVDNTEGLFYLAQGSWDKAECIYREKIVPESANHSPQNQAKAYFNWGKVLARLGKLDPAESCYLKAIELNEENNLVTLLAGLRSDLGALRWRQGKHLQAKADLEAGLRIAYAAGDLSVQSVTIDTLAAVKGELGETEGIVELFERNLKLKESLNNRLGEVCSLLNLAECYCQGIGCKADHALAYERAKKALGLLNEIGSKKFMAEALINLCQASIKLGRRSEAVELAEAALSHATQTSSIVNTALAQGCKGMALADINPVEAEKFLMMAIEGFGKIGNGYEEARHRVELAGLLRKNGRLQEAGESARKAMALYRNLNLNKPLARLMDEFPDLLPAVPVRSAPKNRQSSSPARILVLGKLEIIPAGSDAPLAVGAKGQLVRKILAYLVTTDYNSKSGIDRKEILELFWGDDSFGGSMRVMLSRLKKSLGTSVTLFSSSRYSFAWKDPSVSLDREQFDDLWASGLSLEQKGNLPEAWSVFEQAESLFRGKYLDGMNEPWIKQTRSLMANTHRRLLQKLIALSQKVNKPEEARHFKKKLTSL